MPLGMLQDLRAAFSPPAPPQDDVAAPMSAEEGWFAVWEPSAIVGGEPLLQRWGHSLCQASGSAEEAWVFGGYGYHGEGVREAEAAEEENRWW